MRLWYERLLALMLMTAALSCVAQSIPTAINAQPSPAERSIAESKATIRDKPAQYAGYNLLATALFAAHVKLPTPVLCAS